jgi:hypothetical protein
MSELEHTLGELSVAIDEKSKYNSTEGPMASEGIKHVLTLSPMIDGDDKVYPPRHTVGLIMFGLYIAMFLVALVGSPTIHLKPLLTPKPGSNHYIYGRTKDHRSLPLNRRYWLVRKRLRPHKLCHPTPLWSTLSLLQQ